MTSCEALLDDIERLAQACPGANIKNPRYWAVSLAACVSCNETQELIALEEIREAMRRIFERQTIEQRS